MKMNIIFDSERLYLRVFEAEDVEALKEFWGNEEVMKYCLGATPHEHLPKVIDFYAKCHEEKGLSVYAVVEKETGEVIGGAGFNVPESLEKVELLFHFSKKAWGKGFAKEAANGCIEVVKSHPEVKVVFASADESNLASLRILESVGLTFKGTKWFEDTKQEEPYFEMNL
ncbi:GNAT family N-acetyltransferase [Bacillus timonensis]|nr:GNAT family N-acetyltransferase [Bacillus timonensis]